MSRIQQFTENYLVQNADTLYNKHQYKQQVIRELTKFKKIYQLKTSNQASL